MAQTLPKYSLVPCRDLKERFLRKDYFKGVTLSRPLGHLSKKKRFFGISLEIIKKVIQSKNTRKKFIFRPFA
jgi:hypothetical protein